MNDRLASLLEGYTDRYPHALESKFNRILEKIVALWGTPALDAYFGDLMLMKGGEAREGFPPDVASDIFLLSAAYEKWRGATRVQAAPKGDAWQDITEKRREEFQNLGLEFTPRGFEKAVQANNERGVELFLASGVDPDTRNARGFTPLTIASVEGYDRLIALLFRHGANARQEDNLGYTPLHWAAFEGHDKIVDMLIARGAEVDAASHSSWTPMMQAATRGHLIIVARLLAKGANPNRTTRDGWTALHKAAANGHGAVVQLLLTKGADPKVKHPSGATALTLAREHKHPDIVAMLPAR